MSIFLGSAKHRTFRLLAAVSFLTVLSISLLAAFSGSTRKIKVMPLGDSITASQPNQASYRFWLWQQLVGAGFADKVQFVGENLGCGYGIGGTYSCDVWSCNHNGYPDNTIWNIWGRVPGLIRKDTADVVMIHLGTNDILLPDWPSLAYSKFYLGAIIDSIRVVNPHVTTLLCQIIPGAYNPDQWDSLLELNQYIAQLAVEKNEPSSPVVLVDQFDGISTRDLNSDGFHPNDLGEQIMAGKFFTAILPVLQQMVGLSTQMLPFTHDTRVQTGSPVVLSASVHSYEAASDVSFVSDTVPLGEGVKASDSLYSFTLNPAPGFYNVKAIAKDYDGRVDTSAAVLLGAPANSLVSAITIPQIQGASPSPYLNFLLQTVGVVTAVQKDSTGFWMQDTLGDGNPLTSDAIYVSRNSAVAMPAPGNLVLVRGMVQNYRATANYLATTRLACVDSIAVLSSHHALPTPQIIPVVGQGPNDITTLESGYNAYQGMLVKFTTTALVAPSSQPAFVPYGNTAPGSGFYLSSRVSINESPSANVVDYNPEVFLIGSKTANVPQVRAQDTLFSMTGVVDYDNGWINIQPLADSLSVSHSSRPVSPVSKRSGGGSVRISTFDLGGFFDTLDTWGKNDPVLTGAQYSTKIAKITKAISQELLMPVILCVQNVENTGVLTDIAASVDSVAGGKYAVATGRVYMGFSVDAPSSPDLRGVTNGFLFDSTQMTRDSIILMSGPAIDSAFGDYSPMPAPQPLVGVFNINGSTLAVVNVSFTDKSGDIPCFSTVWPLVEPSKHVRIKQANAVRAWIDAKLTSAPSTLMLVAGEFNDYPFGEPLDGATYPVSIVAGNAGKGKTVFYNAYDYLSPDSRYTCIVNGRAQMTEQLMVNPALASYAKGVDVLHFNANFEDSFAADSTTAVRVSSHDPVEIRF